VRAAPLHRRRVLAAALVLCAAPAFAEEPISTDRPDFVESSATVGPGHVQLETSVAWERTRFAGLATTTWTTPTLLRIGAGTQWEFRVETDGWQRTHVGDDGTASGFSDLALGVKYHIATAGPGGASMAWLVHADLPSGARAVRGEGVRPSLRLSAEWDLPHDNGIGIMPGVIHDTDDAGRRFDAGILAVTFGHAWSPRMRTFVEVAGEQFASQKHGGNVITFDTGATWLLNDDTQVDVAGSFGLSGPAPDEALTLGWSHRW
jgi:hypothetical protein